MNYAVIFAGGIGQRMHTKSVPKQFLLMHGKPIIIHTLAKFSACKAIQGIVVVCIESYIKICELMIKKHHITKVIKIVPGGESGQMSIFNGLNALCDIAEPDDVVLIHDGVRPIVNNELIRKNVKSVHEYGNAITASKATETVVIAENGKTKEVLNRQQCYYARAPQSFRFRDIYFCHKIAQEQNIFDFIDSASMMRFFGYELHIVECDYDNIKITTPIDFYMFKGLLDAKENQQLKKLK